MYSVTSGAFPSVSHTLILLKFMRLGLVHWQFGWTVTSDWSNACVPDMLSYPQLPRGREALLRGTEGLSPAFCPWVFPLAHLSFCSSTCSRSQGRLCLKGMGQIWLSATGELQDEPGSSPRQQPPWRCSCREMGKAAGSWGRRKGEIKPSRPYKGRAAVRPDRWHIIQALSCDSRGNRVSHLPSVLS